MKGSELDVFKESHKMVLRIYEITENFPKKENYRIIDQLVRSAYSVPSNIIEGNNRNSSNEYIHFLYIARGSLHEAMYFLLLSKDLKYIGQEIYQELTDTCNKIGKMLNGLINYLKSKK